MLNQYELILSMLRECSSAFTDTLAKKSLLYKDVFNPVTARFEIDAYLTFHLSSMLLNWDHNRQVWSDLCSLCEAMLCEFHLNIESSNLADVIAARIEEYGDIRNHTVQNGDSTNVELLKSLRQHISASCNTNRVQAEHPIIVGDILSEFNIQIEYVQIDLVFCGMFVCSLKHILRKSEDIRNLSIEQMMSLARLGQDEGIAIAQSYLSKLKEQ